MYVHDIYIIYTRVEWGDMHLINIVLLLLYKYMLCVCVST